jgi:hypothetical protein
MSGSASAAGAYAVVVGKTRMSDGRLKTTAVAASSSARPGERGRSSALGSHRIGAAYLGNRIHTSLASRYLGVSSYCNRTATGLIRSGTQRTERLRKIIEIHINMRDFRTH